MEEKVYNTMNTSGVMNMVIGIVGIVIGVAGGILLIINGAKLLDRKNSILF